MRKIVRLVLALFVGSLALPALAEPAGHAHNDYEHVRPLLDALAHGFTSVEADVWLRDGQLLVGHDEADLDKSRTLQALYLEPLRELTTSPSGNHIANAAPFTLLVDIKTDGRSTYRALSEVLSGYADLLTRVENGTQADGAVIAIVSGNRPKAEMAAENTRYAFFDGRLADLESGLSPQFMPLVSDNWSRHFSWTGAGDMPPEEVERLSGIVATAHAAGYRLRFWATPDSRGPERDALWRALAAAGVDYINTDDLEGFVAFAQPSAVPGG